MDTLLVVRIDLLCIIGEIERVLKDSIIYTKDYDPDELQPSYNSWHNKSLLDNGRWKMKVDGVKKAVGVQRIK